MKTQSVTLEDYDHHDKIYKHNQAIHARLCFILFIAIEFFL